MQIPCKTTAKKDAGPLSQASAPSVYSRFAESSTTISSTASFFAYASFFAPKPILEKTMVPTTTNTKPTMSEIHGVPVKPAIT